jgi:hypothetical protein
MELHPNHRAAVFVVQAPILFPEAVPHLTLEGSAASNTANQDRLQSYLPEESGNFLHFFA